MLPDLISWSDECINVISYSCLINAQPLPADRPAADDNSLIDCTRPRPEGWWVAAYAHFDARLGAFFYWTRCFENNVPFDNTAPIYLINLLRV